MEVSKNMEVRKYFVDFLFKKDQHLLTIFWIFAASTCHKNSALKNSKELHLKDISKEGKVKLKSNFSSSLIFYLWFIRILFEHHDFTLFEVYLVKYEYEYITAYNINTKILLIIVNHQ